MADDLFTGVLGSKDEQPESEAPQAMAGAEAFAAAIAAIASRLFDIESRARRGSGKKCPDAAQLVRRLNYGWAEQTAARDCPESKLPRRPPIGHRLAAQPAYRHSA